MNNIKYTLAIALVLHLLAPSVHAVEQHLVTPDYSKADDISIDPGEPIVGYFHVDRSYECRVSQGKVASGFNDYGYFDTTVAGPTGSIQATETGERYPVEAVTSASLNRRSFHRISFVPVATGIHMFTMQFDGGLGMEATIDCFETSLLGTFNSFFAEIPIVEVRNKGNSPVEVQVTAVDFNGVQVDRKSATVPASSRADLILSVPAQRFGTILVTYLAPRGTLSAIVSEYDFPSGGSLKLKREREMNFTRIIP